MLLFVKTYRPVTITSRIGQNLE